ncbi:hypothetical protein XOCgx_1531 [Xanthomonas oryzae pv. oryzicola]|nr:hypothetical protein XOCgx_1531 [Xanthomonas oryzae pv. oryzicola]
MHRLTLPLTDVCLAPALHHTGDTSFTTRIACTCFGRSAPADVSRSVRACCFAGHAERVAPYYYRAARSQH